MKKGREIHLALVRKKCTQNITIFSFTFYYFSTFWNKFCQNFILIFTTIRYRYKKNNNMPKRSRNRMSSLAICTKKGKYICNDLENKTDISKKNDNSTNVILNNIEENEQNLLERVITMAILY